MFSNLFSTYESVTPPKLMLELPEENFEDTESYESNDFEDLLTKLEKKVSKVDKPVTGEISDFKIPETETEDEVEDFKSPVTSSLVDSIILSGRSLIGKKYKYGGTNPETGLDCSAFLLYIFKLNGINIPRDSSGIFKAGREVSFEDVRPGDIICSKGSGQSGRHVLMVSKVENGQVYVIEAKGKKWGILEGLLEKKPSSIISIRRIINPDTNNPFNKNQDITRPASKGARTWLAYYNQVTDPDAAKYKSVLYRLTSIESSFDPSKTNGNRAFGYTQMYESGPVHNVTRYARTNISNFLRNPVLLLLSSVKLMRDNDKHLTSSVISKGKAKGLSIDDMRAIMWFSGTGGLDAYLQGLNRSDGDTTVSGYLGKFRNAQTLS